MKRSTDNIMTDSHFVNLYLQKNITLVSIGNDRWGEHKTPAGATGFFDF